MRPGHNSAFVTFAAHQVMWAANQNLAISSQADVVPKQAALERHSSARGLLSFGRREGALRATLRTDVEHWQRELAGEQVSRR